MDNLSGVHYWGYSSKSKVSNCAVKGWIWSVCESGEPQQVIVLQSPVTTPAKEATAMRERSVASRHFVYTTPV